MAFRLGLKNGPSTIYKFHQLRGPDRELPAAEAAATLLLATTRRFDEYFSSGIVVHRV
jgi:hypothetical protein